MWGWGCVARIHAARVALLATLAFSLAFVLISYCISGVNENVVWDIDYGD